MYWFAVEKTDRLGGWVHTHNGGSDAEFLFERGPRSLQLRKGEETVVKLKIAAQNLELVSSRTDKCMSNN